MSNMIKYLTLGILPEDSDVATEIKRMASDFVVKDGLLYHLLYIVPRRTKTSNYKKNIKPHVQLVIPENHRDNLLQSFHEEVFQGHHGITAQYEAMRRRFFWFSLYDDICTFIKSCTDCQTGKTKPPQAKLKFMRNIVARCPFDVWGVDVLGPFKSSYQGNKFILVFVCHYSRWIEAFASKTADAETFCNLLVNEIICRYGCMRVLLSDLGTNFTSKLSQLVYRALNLKKLFTTAYHPQTNGKVERVNGKIIPRLKMYVDEHHRDWDELLPRVLYGLRADYTRSLEMSPFYLLHGQDMKLPSDRVLKSLEDCDLSVKKKHRPFVRQLVYDLTEIRRTAELAMEKLITYDEKRHNLSVKSTTKFEIGEKVWVFADISKTGLTKKLLHLWHGPYVVIGVTDVHCELSLPNGTRIKSLVNIERLKKVIHCQKRPKLVLDIGSDALSMVESEFPASSFEKDDDNDCMDDEYEVEKILGVRRKRNKSGRYEKQYLIKWKGYQDEENSWEPENLLSCPDLLMDFDNARKSLGREIARLRTENEESCQD